MKTLRIVPQSFYESSAVKKLLIDGLSCAILKESRSVEDKPGRYVAAHTLTVVLSGTLQVVTYDDATEIIECNRMTFMPKGLYMISDILSPSDDFKAAVFCFDEDIIDEFLRTFPAVGGKECVAAPKVLDMPRELLRYIENLEALYKPQDVVANSKITRHKLIELLYLISRASEAPNFMNVLQGLKNKEKRNILRFMEDNFDKPLKIEDYAYLTGRTLSTFHRDFKRQFNMGPKQWLIERRLKKSLELLSSQNNVTQVAYAVGYENVSHYIKAFQQRYHISPKQHLIKVRNAMAI